MLYRWIDRYFLEREGNLDRLGVIQLMSSRDRFRENVLFLLINVRSPAQFHLRPLAATALAEKLPTTSRCGSYPPFGELPSTDSILHTILMCQLASFLVCWKLCTSGHCRTKEKMSHYVSRPPEMWPRGWEGHHVQPVASGQPCRRICSLQGLVHAWMMPFLLIHMSVHVFIEKNRFWPRRYLTFKTHFLGCGSLHFSYF